MALEDIVSIRFFVGSDALRLVPCPVDISVVAMERPNTMAARAFGLTAPNFAILDEICEHEMHSHD